MLDILIMLTCDLNYVACLRNNVHVGTNKSHVNIVDIIYLAYWLLKFIPVYFQLNKLLQMKFEAVPKEKKKKKAHPEPFNKRKLKERISYY